MVSFRRALVLTATVATVLVVGACGHGDDPTPSPTSALPPTAVLGESPSPGETTTSAPVATTAAPGPSYPGSARAYAEAILAAWKNHQTARLADLTTSVVDEQLLEIPAPISHTWHYSMCEGAAGSSYCTFFNNPGDKIVLKLGNPLLGHAHAGVGVTLEQTEYPTDAVAYVRAFIAAWQDGNTYRMKELGSQAETSYFTHYAPPEPGYSTCTDGAAGSTYVRVYNADGLDYVIRVSNGTLGSAHAITGHVTPPVPPACP